MTHEITSLHVSEISGQDQVGVFNAASRIAFIILMVLPASLNTVLYPVLAAQYAKSCSEFTASVSSLFRMTCLLAFPLAICLDVGSVYGINILFGHEYAAAAPLLRVMALGILFNLVRTSFVAALNASFREKQSVFVLFVATACSIFLNIVLIGRFGAMGAAIATTVAEFIRFVGGGMLYIKYYGIPPVGRYLGKVGVASAVMLVVGHLITPISAVVAIPFALVSFYFVLRWTGIALFDEVSRAFIKPSSETQNAL